MRAFFTLALAACLATSCSEDEATTTGGTSANTTGGAGGETASGGAPATGGAGGAGAAATGGGGSVPDGFVIAFPPPSSLTDAATITVSGTASFDGTVEGVTVAGVPATSSDGFSHWQASVPLSIGTQALSVDVTVDGEAQAGGSVSVDRRETLMTNPAALALDTANQRAFASAGIGGADTVIYEIDLSTGAQREVSSANVGSGPDFDDELFTLSWDPNGQQILAFDINDLWAIDPVTGERTVIKDKPAGGPPWPSAENTAEVDTARNRIVATTGHANTWVMAVELTAPFSIVDISRGDLGVPTIGAGPEFSEPHGLTLDLANDRALVVDDATDNQLFAVDLTTGDRTVLSGTSQGTGTLTAFPQRVAYQPGKTWSTHEYVPDIVEVDLTTGDRTLFVDEQLGTGPIMLLDTDIAHDGSRLLATDTLLDAVVNIDTATGARSIASGYSIGTGESVLSPYAAVWDPATGRTLVADAGYQGLFAVDLTDGSRTLISSNFLAVGSGPGFSVATDIAVGGGDAFVVSGNVTRVDLTTGDREVLTSDAVGGGPLPGSINAIAVRDDPPSDMWILTASRAVMHVDPTSGDRTLVADDTTGTGPPLENPRDVIFDADGDRLLVLTHGYLYALDPATGDRTELSGINVGTGPSLVAARIGILHGSALYAGSPFGWVRVDLATSDRTEISDDDSLGPIRIPFGYAMTDAGLLLTTDTHLGALVATDPLSGERVIISK